MEDFTNYKLIGRGDVMNVSFGDDRSTYAVFTQEDVEDIEASNREGRVIKKSMDFIEMRFAGDRYKVVKRPVKMEADKDGPSDPQRFPNAWQAYQNQNHVAETGTRIEDWPVLSRGQMLDLKSRNILTVEALATMSDAHISFMGGVELKKKAAAWLLQAKDGAEASRLVEENEALRRDIESLKMQMASILSRNIEVTEEPKGRGRPPVKKETSDVINSSGDGEAIHE